MVPMTRRYRTPLALAALPLAASFTLVSCSSGGAEIAADEATPQDTMENRPASDTPSDVLLDGSSAPEGYSYEAPDPADMAELAKFFDGEEDAPTQATTPPQCASLAVDSGLLMEWMLEPTDRTAVASFTLDGDDESGVFVRVTRGTPQDGLPDAAECGEYFRDMDTEMGTMEKYFVAEPVDVELDDVDERTAADVTVTDLLLGGEELDSEAVGETVLFVAATANGWTVNVIVAGEADEELALALAQEQVDRMRVV
ncbi:hypothetical protein [Corynebacterium sp. AOP12-C2-36]|uniref:hypothetical protein n=1 Tax=Corynebacterium sp. AOP12-C2-36 TaxID=3457723 RepID=UPI00403416E5